MYTIQPSGKFSKNYKSCINSLCKASRKVLPRSEHRLFMNTIITLLDHHGITYTCNYLKAIYNCAGHLVEGNREFAINTLADSRVKSTQRGYPMVKGFTWLIRTIEKGGTLRVNSKAKMEALWALARSYTMFSEDSLTIKQFKKLLDSIAGSKPKVDTTKRREVEDAIIRQYFTYADQYLKPTHPRYDHPGSQVNQDTDYVQSELQYRYIESKNLNMLQYVRALNTLYENNYEVQLSTPDACSLSPYSKVYVNWMGFTKEDVEFLKSYCNKNPGAHLILSCATSSFSPKSVKDKYVNNEGWEVTKRDNIARGIDTTIAGRISVIQESGAKARVIAVPNANVQMLFQPLNKYLASLLKRQENSYFNSSFVFDQAKGAQIVENLVSTGNEVYSVDLSAATDNYPRNLQCAYLRIVGLSKWADAMNEVASANWELPAKASEHYSKIGSHFRRLIKILPTGEKVISYSKGQPMGLYASFNLFHTCHYHMAMAIWKLMSDDVTTLFENGFPFVMLGDDIVWSDKACALMYVHWLSRLGIQTSPLKCFSGLMSEFAGHITVPSRHPRSKGRQYVSFVPYKWKSKRDEGETRISSIINYIKTFGLNPYNMVSHRRQYKQAEKFRIANTIDKASTMYKISEGQSNTVKVLSPRILSDLCFNLCYLVGYRFKVHPETDVSGYSFFNPDGTTNSGDKDIFTVLTKNSEVPAKAHLETTIMGVRELSDPGHSEFVNKLRRISMISADSKYMILSNILGSHYDYITSNLQQLFQGCLDGHGINVGKLTSEGFVFYNPRNINQAALDLREWRNLVGPSTPTCSYTTRFGTLFVDLTDIGHFVISANNALCSLFTAYLTESVRTNPNYDKVDETLSTYMAMLFSEMYSQYGEHQIQDHVFWYLNRIKEDNRFDEMTLTHILLDNYDKVITHEGIKSLIKSPLPKYLKIREYVSSGIFCRNSLTPESIQSFDSVLMNLADDPPLPLDAKSQKARLTKIINSFPKGRPRMRIGKVNQVTKIDHYGPSL